MARGTAWELHGMCELAITVAAPRLPQFGNGVGLAQFSKISMSATLI
jgi:hypothetical protein